MTAPICADSFGSQRGVVSPAHEPEDGGTHTSPRPSPHRLRRLRRRGEGETLAASWRCPVLGGSGVQCANFSGNSHPGPLRRFCFSPFDPHPACPPPLRYVATSRPPSSSPAPAGEGHWREGNTLPVSMKIPAAGLVIAAFNRHAGTPADSFSPREKDRMRGKSVWNDPAAPCFLESRHHHLTH